MSFNNDHLNNDRLNNDRLNNDHLNNDRFNNNRLNNDHLNNDHLNNDRLNKKKLNKLTPNNASLSLWLALPALALLAIPFITLFIITPWRHLELLWGDGSAIAVSVGLGGLALALIILLGLPVAWWLSQTHHPGKLIAELLVLIPLLTPPLAMGILLISAWGPYSLPGQWLNHFGLTLVNNPPAFVVAQIYAALPYFITAARSAFSGISRDILETGQTLGASPWRCFTQLAIPLAAPGLASGVALAWVRAVGEFGIVMMFAYFPQGIPVKLYTNLQNDGVNGVYILLWLLLLFTLPLPLYCFKLAKAW